MSIDNLRKLLATGERLLAEPHTNTLGFDKVDCGTYACLLGWYVRDHGHAGLVRGFESLRFLNSEAIEAHFGITEHQSDALFLSVCDLNDHSEEGSEGERPLDERADEPGPEAYVELERRLVVLRHVIASRRGSGE